MTRKLDLRTGKPVWLAYSVPRIPCQKLLRDVKCDVLVVGMGISGAMVAEALTAAGHSVVCMDRRAPLAGSTSATTALVQFEIDQPISRLLGMIGKASAQQAWRRSRLALTNLKGRIEALQVKCGLTTTQSLYLAGNVLGPPELREEAIARRATGIAATYLTSKPLFDSYGIKRAGAILSHDNIALDPRKLTAGLLLRSLERKARFYAPVEAMKIESSRDGVAVQSNLGPILTAKHLVLATGYELVDIVPRKGHQLISTWAIATRPQPSKLWPGSAFMWEASDPYLYVRATADGRVICGGEDEDFSDETLRDKLIASKSQQISRKLSILFPQLDPAPEFAWAGTFGSTATGLPFIGSVPMHPRIHAVMGYGGNGITFSQLASEIVTASIEGYSDADANLFAFPHT